MKEDIYENKWDKLLKIHTMGRDDSNAGQYYYPYEPTPYSVLERLANTGIIRKGNTLLDYGCGKGRVDFFLAYQTRCRSIGVEYDERIYNKAIENKEKAISAGRIAFKAENAEYFSVPREVDRIYFFNPFSLEILQKVIHRILESYYEKPREIKILKRVVARILESYYENPRPIQLMFYYPSDEYISYLMTVDEFMFEDEIDCRDLFPGNDMRERIVIFGL